MCLLDKAIAEKYAGTNGGAAQSGLDSVVDIVDFRESPIEGTWIDPLNRWGKMQMKAQQNIENMKSF